MITREQIEEIQAESREKGISIKRVLQEKGIPEHQYFWWLATCKAHGVDERAWLEDVLRRIPQYEQGQKDFSDLLPGNWAAAVQ